MEKALQTLNEMEAAGLVIRYAIGGAVAAFFYSEAVVTEDLDAFVLLAPSTDGLVTLTPVYEFLKGREAVEQREHLLVGGTLLQVIPAYDALTEEAVQEATERWVGQTPTRVMRVEHLIAIALATGRAKDFARIALLLEEAEVDASQLAEVLRRHQLLDKWNQYKAARP